MDKKNKNYKELKNINNKSKNLNKNYILIIIIQIMIKIKDKVLAREDIVLVIIIDI